MLAISPPLSRSPSPIHRFPTITTTAPPSTSPQKHTPTLHISTRSIVFNTRINTPVYTTFTLHNPTPIAIHYTIQSTTQFYIADTNGVIIPQQTKTVEIAFLDHQEGTREHVYIIHTTPYAGDIQLKVRSYVELPHAIMDTRNQLAKNLKRRLAKNNAKQIIQYFFDQITMLPERLDLHRKTTAREQAFLNCNKPLKYPLLAQDLPRFEALAPPGWDLSIMSLHAHILTQTPVEGSVALTKLQSLLNPVTTITTPPQHILYGVCSDVMRDFFDTMVDISTEIRGELGLTLKRNATLKYGVEEAPKDAGDAHGAGNKAASRPATKMGKEPPTSKKMTKLGSRDVSVTDLHSDERCTRVMDEWRSYSKARRAAERVYLQSFKTKLRAAFAQSIDTYVQATRGVMETSRFHPVK